MSWRPKLRRPSHARWRPNCRSVNRCAARTRNPQRANPFDRSVDAFCTFALFGLFARCLHGGVKSNGCAWHTAAPHAGEAAGAPARPLARNHRLVQACPWAYPPAIALALVYPAAPRASDSPPRRSGNARSRAHEGGHRWLHSVVVRRDAGRSTSACSGCGWRGRRLSPRRRSWQRSKPTRLLSSRKSMSGPHALRRPPTP